MKLSFTTLGCMDWNLQTIIAKALEYGYQGVDFRGYLNELDLTKFPEFTANIADTKKLFDDAGLAVSCISSSARLTALGTEKTAHLAEVKAYCAIAAALGAGYVRVFGGGLDGRPYTDALPDVSDFLHAISAYALAAGVEIVVETHDDWVDTKKLLHAFEYAAFPEAVSILWDVNHPYRMANEAPADTYARIGKHIKYTHWKDGALLLQKNRITGEIQEKDLLTLPGFGTLPLEEFYALLKRGGYDGWYTLEWEKKWRPEIERAEIAFPKYVEVMRKIEAASAG
jgi:Sugar phosphate isomerases/epimerases